MDAGYGSLMVLKVTVSPMPPPRFARSCGVHDMSPRLHVAGQPAACAPLDVVSMLRCRMGRGGQASTYAVGEHVALQHGAREQRTLPPHPPSVPSPTLTLRGRRARCVATWSQAPPLPRLPLVGGTCIRADAASLMSTTTRVRARCRFADASSRVNSAPLVSTLLRGGVCLPQNPCPAPR